MDTAVEQEEERLHYWHIDRFCELGFEGHQAEILELAKVDWHDLEMMLAQGCSLALALEILT